MNQEEFKNTIENARLDKKISQRELAKLSDINRSTLNDIINGKTKKVDVEALKKISEVLDLSLEKLLKEAGYNDFVNFLSKDRFENKSTTDLKNLVNSYKEGINLLLEFDSNKSRDVTSINKKIYFIVQHLEIMLKNEDSLYTVDKAIDDLKEALKDIEKIDNKFDYSNLPKDIQ